MDNNLEAEQLNLKPLLLVSVVVPVYNSERYVSECVESILQQNYKNIELLLINDGSTDSSGMILRSLESDKVRVVNTENKGVSEARNKGLELAQGKYIVFVDADDLISPDYIEYMLGIIEKTNSEFVLSLNHFTNQDKNQIDIEQVHRWLPTQATEELLYPRITVGCWNKMYCRDFLVKNKIRFQSELFFGEGLRFITDVSQRATSIGVGTRKVYWYRTNNESCTSNHDVKKALASLDSLKSIEKNMTLESSDVWVALKSHFWLNHFLAVRFMISGSYRKENRAFYTECKNYLRSNIVDIYKSRMPLTVKLAALVIFVAPGPSARIFNHLRSNR